MHIIVAAEASGRADGDCTCATGHRKQGSRSSKDGCQQGSGRAGAGHRAR